ncbi:uncharacterized protein LOC134437386 [Engraulis encrasicolus]|uniref:uncharacterized protein LOC134437386 n=1 Tax=Engraulis encrasicolus TaxID=184585 RepID=UPI002FCFD2D5
MVPQPALCDGQRGAGVSKRTGQAVQAGHGNSNGRCICSKLRRPLSGTMGGTLKDFHLYLNSINHNIKLSLEFSTTSINFLDLNIYVDSDGTLHTTIYRKPTDRNTILRADSFHPNSLISNIPYGQFQRLRRICDSDTDFETQSAEMYERFKQRGYKDRTLNSALSKSRSTERTNLFKPKPRRPVSNRIFCSLQYTNQTNSIKQIIKNNWDILRSDTTLAPVFSEPPQFAVKKGPHSQG